jgi:hypothetical protein
MWMRIFLGGPAVRGPASMANAVSAFAWILAQSLLKVPQFSRRAADVQLIPIYDGDAGRVITTILESFEANDQDRKNGLMSQISNNSTH